MKEACLRKLLWMQTPPSIIIHLQIKQEVALFFKLDT